MLWLKFLIQILEYRNLIYKQLTAYLVDEQHHI